MKKKLVLLLSLTLMTGLLYGCGTKNEEAKNNAPANTQEQEAEKPEAMEETEAVSLADWEGEGTWNNFVGYLDKDEVLPGFEELAKKENISVDEAKAELKKARECEFNGIEFKDGKVTFLDGFKSEGGKEIETVEYEFKDSKEVKHGNSTLEWDIFEAKGDAKYPVILLMPVHGEEELTHFHMRYGSDAEELLARDDWYPTFVAPSTTTDQLIEEIGE